MRRIMTNRAGFTLVEIMVAFVIFAIMAGMVSSILAATAHVKQENTEISREILDQQTAYYLSGNLDQSYSSSETNYDLTLGFDQGVGSVVIKYNIADPNDPTGDNLFTLEYMVGNVDYSELQNAAAGEETENEASTGSVTSRLDTRLYGSTKMSSEIVVLQKDLTYLDGHRYFIAVKPSAPYDATVNNTVADLEQYFLQCRFTFGTSNKVVDCGYATYSTVTGFGSTTVKDWQSAVSYPYEVIPTSPYTVRLSGKQAKEKSLLQTSVYNGWAGIYVTLASPLSDMAIITNADGTKATQNIDTIATTAQKADGSYYNVGDARTRAAQIKMQLENSAEQLATLVSNNAVVSSQITTLQSEISTLETEIAALNAEIDAWEWGEHWSVPTRDAKVLELANKESQLAAKQQEYADNQAIIDAINANPGSQTEYDELIAALNSVNVYLNMNVDFGYSDSNNTSTLGSSGYQFTFKPYQEQKTDSEGNAIYEELEDGTSVPVYESHPGVFGAFPKADDETAESETPTE